MVLIEYLAALAALVTCGGAGLIRRAPSPWLVVRGLLVVCAASLVAFFALLVHLRLLAVLTSYITLVIGALGWVVVAARYRHARPDRVGVARTASLAAVMLCLALFPLLAFYGSASAADPFASTRSQLHLPIDNMLPATLAKAVESEVYPSPLIGDWLGSDRPPLQAGFIVLADPLLTPFMGQPQSAFVVSVASQTTWLAGAALLIYAVFGRSSIIGAGLTTCGLSGAALLNAIFTWPKMLAAGLLLACVAVCLAALRGPRLPFSKQWRIWLVAGLLAGLSCLAHGVSLFAVLALALVLALFSKGGRGTSRLKAPGVLLATTFALQVPWMAWQRWGDPPGDRLLKYHLSGVTNLDPRSFPQTLVDSYRELGFAGAVDFKLDNLATLMGIPETPISPLLSLTEPVLARASDFFSLLASVSWAVPVLATTVFALPALRRPGTQRAHRAALTVVLTWTAVTALVWCLLMFGPATTVNHQGPLTLSLVPLTLAGSWARAHGPWPWVAGTALQGAAFVWLYGLAPDMSFYQTPLWAAVMAGQCLLTAVTLSALPLGAGTSVGPSPAAPKLQAHIEGAPAPAHAARR